MPNLAVKNFSKRIGRRTQITVLAMVAAPVAALTLAAPAYAATYTADACTRSSNTQCIFSGVSFNGLNANDEYPKNNNTLNEWKFHNSSTFIDTNLGSVYVYRNNKVSYCTGTSGNGTCATIPAHGPTKSKSFLQNTQGARLLSFKWKA